MWGSIVSALLSKVAPKVADYYIKKQELKAEVELETLRGKAAWQKALTQRASESEGRDHEWELAMIENSGWKDEWVLGLVSIPMILAFLPGGSVVVDNGFTTLSATPLWYQGMIVTIFLAIYGIRKWRRNTQASTILAKTIKKDL